ncbi:hypothetical protein NF699_06155 [Sphingomonadaceae bacterium OTU29LAMAA1]|nr:hypothetical protein NF699_06155 [Sphingomonadaceae bacterium OTU29LAMAA1]
MIGGYSNGGVWAATMAARFPQLFGNVLVMSAGAASAASSAGKLGASRVFAGAGIYETDFRKTTIAVVNAAKAAGAETRFREVVSGHAMPTWDLIFADAYPWFFPR